MEEREIVIRLDREAKRIVCRLLRQHVEALKEKAEGQKTFTRLLLAHEMDRTSCVLDQIATQWAQALPSLPAMSALPEPDAPEQ
ncbi:hypothetical protein [Lihuaxuella thermophila]|uniref:Uncharacterized protein n=1 Tax=Lihuaxuella thermophila TaxID=1173111 RepID=A0A1H8H1J2_9BACL|nr:hypothetical protein [Lihuaxuella thermophila]SEN50261.1 hypothetical protein SAMN05444955_1134 [Lihuaxuella thermophila]